MTPTSTPSTLRRQPAPFRFISPEDGAELEALRTYTRHFMRRMEADLGTGLDWVAVNRWNTDKRHTHLIVRGRDDTG